MPAAQSLEELRSAMDANRDLARLLHLSRPNDAERMISLLDLETLAITRPLEVAA